MDDIDKIIAAKRSEEMQRAEQVYAQIDPIGYYQKYGEWPRETESQRKEREHSQRQEELREYEAIMAERRPKPLETPEETRIRQEEERKAERRAIEAIMAEHRAFDSGPSLNPTNVYDNEDYQEAMARTKMIHQQEDAPKVAVIDSLKQQLPPNSEELKAVLEQTDMRIDMLKDLVETYANRTMSTLKADEETMKPENNQVVNKVVADYLNLIATLSSKGYNFGSVRDSFKSSQYDPYKPEMHIDELSSALFRRRRNGLDINMPLPKDYDLNNPQPSADGINILMALSEELKHNPEALILWERLGYKNPKKAFAEERSKQVEEDKVVREALLKNMDVNKGMGL